MNNEMHRRPAFAVAALMLAMTLAAPASRADDVDGLPSVETQGNVRFVSGGIGEPSVSNFKIARGKWPIGLLFGSSSGGRAHYEADVHVLIRAAEGGEPLLDTMTRGPFLLVDLPAGRYSISATAHGKEQVKAATVVAGRGLPLSFVWQLAPGTAD